MQIGLSWKFDITEEWSYALALAPEWTKIGLAVDDDAWPDYQGVVVPMLAEAGVRPVVDLRTNDRSWFGRTAPPEAWAWEEMQWQNERLFETFASRCSDVVTRLAPYCRDWEIWGEAPCRWVGNVLFEGGRYNLMLAEVVDAIRTVQGDARIWFGGHGVSGDVSFWERCEEDGAGDLYDVNNLHCFSHARKWETVEQQFDMMFSTIAGEEMQRGHNHTLGSTEFGWPTHPDGAGVRFNSKLVDSVLSIDEETSAEWLDRSLALFEYEGMGEVCYLSLRESDPESTQWGAHIGLHRHDWTPKPELKVWQNWRSQ